MIQALLLVTQATTSDVFLAHLAGKIASTPFTSLLLLNYADTKFKNLGDCIDKVYKLTERLLVVHWKATMAMRLGGYQWAAGTMNPE